MTLCTFGGQRSSGPPADRRCFSSLRAQLWPEQWWRKPLPAALGPQGATPPTADEAATRLVAAAPRASPRPGPELESPVQCLPRRLPWGASYRTHEMPSVCFLVTPVSPPKQLSPSNGSGTFLPLHRCRMVTIAAQPRRDVPCLPWA